MERNDSPNVMMQVLNAEPPLIVQQAPTEIPQVPKLASEPNGEMQKLPPEALGIEDLLSDDKMRRGWSKIKELDKILNEKTALSKKIHQETLNLSILNDEQGSVSSRRSLTPSNSSKHSSAVEAPWNGPWKMLRYLRSLDHTDESLEHQTFLTEPATFHVQHDVPYNESRQSREGTATSSAKEKRSKKSSEPKSTTTQRRRNEQAKFIQRNIELGKDAKFFSSLTKEEQERVETVLKLIEMEEEDNKESSLEENTTGKAKISEEEADEDRLLRESAIEAFVRGFVPEKDEQKRLEEIDRLLKRISSAMEKRTLETPSITVEEFNADHPESEYNTRTASRVSRVTSDSSAIIYQARKGANDAQHDTQSIISSTPTMRDVESVMSGGKQDMIEIQKLMKEDQMHLRQIDERLENLQNLLINDEASLPVLDRETVEKLLEDAKIEGVEEEIDEDNKLQGET